MHGEEHTTECYFYFFLDHFELGPQSTRNSNDDIASCCLHFNYKIID